VNAHAFQGILRIEDTIDNAQRLCNAGFRTFSIKVGTDPVADKKLFGEYANA